MKNSAKMYYSMLIHFYKKKLFSAIEIIKLGLLVEFSKEKRVLFISALMSTSDFLTFQFNNSLKKK